MKTRNNAKFFLFARTLLMLGLAIHSQNTFGVEAVEEFKKTQKKTDVPQRAAELNKPTLEVLFNSFWQKQKDQAAASAEEWREEAQYAKLWLEVAKGKLSILPQSDQWVKEMEENVPESQYKIKKAKYLLEKAKEEVKFNEDKKESAEEIIELIPQKPGPEAQQLFKSFWQDKVTLPQSFGFALFCNFNCSSCPLVLTNLARPN